MGVYYHPAASVTVTATATVTATPRATATATATASSFAIHHSAAAAVIVVRLYSLLNLLLYVLLLLLLYNTNTKYCAHGAARRVYLPIPEPPPFSYTRAHPHTLLNNNSMQYRGHCYWRLSYQTAASRSPPRIFRGFSHHQTDR